MWTAHIPYLVGNADDDCPVSSSHAHNISLHLSNPGILHEAQRDSELLHKGCLPLCLPDRGGVKEAVRTPYSVR